MRAASILKSEVNSSLSHLKQSYTQVHVLCIYWEENDVHPEEEIQKLRECFEQHFNYTVASLALPADHTRNNRLQREIVNLVHDYSTNETSLIVIYYAGHCDKDANGQAEWQA